MNEDLGEIPRVPTPAGLAKQGRKLWRNVTKRYELRPDELILLEHAARTVDLVAGLESAMEGQPLTVKGSMGQEREHPLLSEARQQRALMARLLGQLKLPDEGVVDGLGTARSVAARDAARSRWSPGAHARR